MTHEMFLLISERVRQFQVKLKFKDDYIRLNHSQLEKMTFLKGFIRLIY